MNHYDNPTQGPLKKARICCWRYEKREDAKPTKLPYNRTTGRKAAANKPETFCCYADALTAVSKHDGLGICVSNGLRALWGNRTYCKTEWANVELKSLLTKSITLSITC